MGVVLAEAFGVDIVAAVSMLTSVHDSCQSYDSDDGCKFLLPVSKQCRQRMRSESCS